MGKVYLVLIPDTLEEKSIESVSEELEAKGVDVTFVRVGCMPAGKVTEVIEFEAYARKEG